LLQQEGTSSLSHHCLELPQRLVIFEAGCQSQLPAHASAFTDI
jgi:hypothetical protein